MNSDAPTDPKVEGLKMLLRGLERPIIIKELLPQVKGLNKKELEAAIMELVASNDVTMKTCGNLKIYYYNYNSAHAQAMVSDLFLLIPCDNIDSLAAGRERGSI